MWYHSDVTVISHVISQCEEFVTSQWYQSVTSQRPHCDVTLWYHSVSSLWLHGDVIFIWIWGHSLGGSSLFKRGYGFILIIKLIRLTISSAHFFSLVISIDSLNTVQKLIPYVFNTCKCIPYFSVIQMWNLLVKSN